MKKKKANPHLGDMVVSIFSYNVNLYDLKTDNKTCEGLTELLSRLESYQHNGLTEEQWAWGAAIEEVKKLQKTLNCITRC